MATQTLPETLPRPFRPGRMLAGPVPPHFEAFYREHLRWRCGRRIGSTELLQRYLAWGEQVEAQGLTYWELRRAMENIGHRRGVSNGIVYFDVEFADQLPGVPDNFPSQGEGGVESP